MSNMLIQLRKSIRGCAISRERYERLSTQELHQRLRSERRKLWVIGGILAVTMALVYVITGEREDVLSMFTISGASMIWIGYEDYRKRAGVIKEVLRDRKD